ncbi:MAG: alpha-E domain-containing protein [Alphaproteobacteria bacterium]|nr:alpha-E domain-containing protein [Alphaproteobacteria bacterium]
MLSRTAQNLFWMGRYIERADATARIIEMGHRMAMLPGSNEMEEWRSVALASGSAPDLAGEEDITPAQVIHRLLIDADNFSSIRSCLASARANGRAIRTALTQDMWEALNDGWRQLGEMDPETARRSLLALLEWTKNRTAAFRGAAEGSLLRNDGYFFLRLGGLIERADMTLRLLDVKYYVLLPETDVVGGGRDYHQWTSVLRATSALRAYHHVYKGDYSPWGIADFLILNSIFPRSVSYCYRAILRFLEDLAELYGERSACHDTCAAMVAQLDELEIERLFQSGLHEFIDGAIVTTQRLSGEISRAYHF